MFTFQNLRGNTLEARSCKLHPTVLTIVQLNMPGENRKHLRAQKVLAQERQHLSRRKGRKLQVALLVIAYSLDCYLNL